MRSAVELYESLKRKHNGIINFKKVCEEEGIIAAKATLPDGIDGFCICAERHKVIVLNESIPYEERRDVSFHELYHVLRDPSDSKRSNDAADLFAALCRAPIVRDEDTIETLVERYNVSRRIAKIRIQHENNNGRH